MDAPRVRAAPAPPAAHTTCLPLLRRPRRDGSVTALLVALGAVNQVEERRARQVAPEVHCEKFGALVVVAREKTRDVGRDDDVVEPVEGMPGGRRLLGEDVDGGTR